MRTWHIHVWGLRQFSSSAALTIAVAALAPLPVTRAQIADQDVVERISDEPDATEVIELGTSEDGGRVLTPPPPAPPAPAPSADRIELHGWVRQSLELG